MPGTPPGIQILAGHNCNNLGCVFAPLHMRTAYPIPLLVSTHSSGPICRRHLGIAADLARQDIDRVCFMVRTYNT